MAGMEPHLRSKDLLNAASSDYGRLGKFGTSVRLRIELSSTASEMRTNSCGTTLSSAHTYVGLLQLH